MGVVLRVQVPAKGDHPDRSEPQLQKGDRLWEGSGERNRGPMYKNRIRGDAGGASGQMTAKPRWSRRGDVNPAVVR